MNDEFKLIIFNCGGVYLVAYSIYEVSYKGNMFLVWPDTWLIKVNKSLVIT